MSAKINPCDLVNRMESFLLDYVSFADDSTAFALALWCIATYVFELFDAFPYIVITSATKRSGKSRLAELIGFLSHHPQNCAAVTPASIFRIIDEFKPTLLIDEAESLSSESSSDLRSILNVGYRKGTTIPRGTTGGGVRQFPTYCPKVFVLIGDVNDTLRDRSIIISLKRAEPKCRFDYSEANNRGTSFRQEIEKLQGEPKSFGGVNLAAALADAYKLQTADYLGDRDEEIWRPLLVLCRLLCPARYGELERIAVDLSTEKTAPAKTFDELAGVEDAALRDEYGKRLLYDVATIFSTQRKQKMFSQELLDALHALNTGPWRKFKGEGLTLVIMSDMLRPFGITTSYIRQDKRVLRGYSIRAVAKAVDLYLPEKKQHP